LFCLFLVLHVVNILPINGDNKALVKRMQRKQILYTLYSGCIN
jgi:hypothetical protein